MFRAGIADNGTNRSVNRRDLATGATATQTYSVDLPGLVGGPTADVGFTGATGGETAVQDVLNWTYWG